MIDNQKVAFSKQQKVTATTQSSFVPAKESSLVKKHKLSGNDVSPAKKPKTDAPSSEQSNAPLGPEWDAQNYSCSYDALFTILFNIWQLAYSEISMSTDLVFWLLDLTECSITIHHLRLSETESDMS